jgi:hypothetical protein
LIRQEGIGDAEVLVVNDGATENCLATVERFRARLNIHYVKAGFRSLGKARNLGFQEAKSPVVAYLDDDAIADEGWLTSLSDDFTSLVDFAGQTGPVAPNGSWDEASEWLHPAVANQLFSLVPDRPASVEMHYPENPMGCNMAFKRDFLLQSGGFAPNIQSYDEASVVWPAMKQGHRFFFNRNMRARHRVDPGRLAPQFLWRKFRAQGAAYQCLLPVLRRHGIRPSALRSCLDWLRPPCGYIISFILRDRRKKTAFLAQMAFQIGRLQGFLGDVGDYYEKPKTD